MMKNLLLSILLLISVFAFAQKRIVVAKDGTGNFKKVQEAFNSVPNNNKKPIIIFVRNGIYKEKLHLETAAQLVRHAIQWVGSESEGVTAQPQL